MCPFLFTSLTIVVGILDTMFGSVWCQSRGWYSANVRCPATKSDVSPLKWRARTRAADVRERRVVLFESGLRRRDGARCQEGREERVRARSK